MYLINIGLSWAFPTDIIENENLVGSINGAVVGGAKLVILASCSSPMA